MNKYLYILFFFAFSVSAGNSYSGQVKDDLLDQPISFVQVMLYDNLFNKIDSTFTDTQGLWQIDHKPAGIDETQNIPKTFTLNQNYPNPFNPSTVISFNVADAGEVKIMVSDILGQIISTKSAVLPNGSYSIDWYGARSAGVYFYTLVHNEKSVTCKMVQLDGHNSDRGLSEFKPNGTSPKIAFTKISTDDYFIVLSKYAYVDDTLKIESSGNHQFNTYLKSIHSNSLLFDLHNDVLERMIGNPGYHLADEHNYWHTDIPRLKRGGVDAQLFVAWVSPSSYAGRYYETTQEMIQIFKDEVFSNSNDLVQAYNASSVLEAVNDNKIAGVLVVEGGHSIENSIDKLKTLYSQGMRYLTITWNNSTEWAVSAADSRSATVGLSDFGKQVIRTMDTLGIIIDISHTGIKTIEDILEVTTNPIIASHSGVRALQNHSRNLYDDQIVDIANSGGVIGVVFYPPFLGSPSSSVNINTVIKHINHIVNLVGIDHAALGSDFDGIGTNTVNGLEDVTKFPYLTYQLLQEGYTREEIEKILGGNFMRVFSQVCGD